MQFRMRPVLNGRELRSLHAAAPPVQSEYPAERRAVQQCHCRKRHKGKLRHLSPPSVLFESNAIFYSTQETDAKMMDQNFEIRIL